MSSELKAGDSFTVDHPFVRDTSSVLDDGYHIVGTWRPGTRQEGSRDDRGEVDTVADAVGAQILTVVAVFKPGKYRTRVFYTRKWRDPRGRIFGKDALRVTSEQAFKTLIRGYRWPFAVLGAKAEDVAA